jgi:hypothetical protein
MQYLVYSINQSPEAATTPPSPQLMEEMGKFVGEAMAKGKIVTTGGLEATSKRLKLENGKFTLTDGPYIEAKELLGGFAVIRADSLEEAIDWAKRFRTIVGDGETEIVRMFGAE